MHFLNKLLLSLVMMSSTHFAVFASQEKEIDAIVEEALETFHVPGAAVAVVSEGKILLCRGYGLRDLEKGLPVTQNTVFPIGSNTKAFTSFLISQLVEEEKLAWDDPVIKYLPEFRLYTKELSSQVTIRDLIAHRTGIPRHDALWCAVRDLSEEEVLQVLQHFPPLFGLRETFLYNNLMYVVAGKVIQAVTQNTWEEELSSRILKPLGMQQSGTSLKQLQQLPDISQPYARIEEKTHKLPFFSPCSVPSAADIHSSASDMAKWVQVQLLEGTHKEAHAIHMPISAPENAGYGLGWKIDTFKGKKHVHHDGIMEGFSSEVSLLPDQKIGLVLLTNSSTDGRFAISSIENRIYDLLLEAKDTERLQKYEGNYIHPAYGTLQISCEFDSLIASLGKMRVPLKLKEEGIFEGKLSALRNYGVDPLVEFSFFSNPSGEVDEVRVPFEGFRSAPAIIFKK